WQAVSLGAHARTTPVDMQDDKDAFDLEAEFQCGRRGGAWTQGGQRDRQPARLERIAAASRLHQRRAPPGKRRYRLAQFRTPRCQGIEDSCISEPPLDDQVFLQAP